MGHVLDNLAHRKSPAIAGATVAQVFMMQYLTNCKEIRRLLFKHQRPCMKPPARSVIFKAHARSDLYPQLAYPHDWWAGIVF